MAWPNGQVRATPSTRGVKVRGYAEVPSERSCMVQPEPGACAGGGGHVLHWARSGPAQRRERAVSALRTKEGKRGSLSASRKLPLTGATLFWDMGVWSLYTPGFNFPTGPA